MEWNVWVIKPYGITNRQLSNDSFPYLKGKETFPSSSLQKFGLLSVEIVLFYPVVVLQFFPLVREVLLVKWTRLLSQNQIRETVMDSDSDEDKYNASEES
jgi:hypothetical protein